jgi:hypothetical protein
MRYTLRKLLPQRIQSSRSGSIPIPIPLFTRRIAIIVVIAIPVRTCCRWGRRTVTAGVSTTESGEREFARGVSERHDEVADGAKKIPGRSKVKGVAIYR